MGVYHKHKVTGEVVIFDDRDKGFRIEDITHMACVPVLPDIPRVSISNAVVAGHKVVMALRLRVWVCAIARVLRVDAKPRHNYWIYSDSDVVFVHIFRVVAVDSP